MSNGEQSGEIAHITDAEFSSAVADGITLVDFWAPWCGPCKKMGTVLEEIAATGEVGGALKICKINVDENTDRASEFGISSIPALLVFKGGKMIKQLVGYRGKDELLAEINPLIKV